MALEAVATSRYTGALMGAFVARIHSTDGHDGSRLSDFRASRVAHAEKKVSVRRIMQGQIRARDAHHTPNRDLVNPLLSLSSGTKRCRATLR
ncbi:hypothetical protein BD311DRAFT_769731 [Dichomitus squalens]|uniref:Uncharacterized protein n=1 Tax=Dichomitus squalens TaxID=114155 RepID=A0A4Q9M790_9APHY|nr:hypothetical protein BD311DRAFT_769731 [Dichomitus squalens]